MNPLGDAATPVDDANLVDSVLVCVLFLRVRWNVCPMSDPDIYVSSV